LPRALTGPFAPSRDWDALQRAYEAYEGDDLEPLATANNIKLKTLQNYACEKHWRRHDAPPLPPPPPLLKVATAAPDAGGDKPVTIVTQAALNSLLVRLFNVIAVKLHQLEIRMQENKPLSQADHEREMRMIGSLTKNAEKVHELSRPSEDTDAPKSRAAAKADTAETERTRRELKARIQRLRERSVE
jgi:hypothetical protein